MGKKSLAIIGSGEFAKIAFEYFNDFSNFEIVGFCVEKKFIVENTLYNLPIVPLEEINEVFNPTEHVLFTAITFTYLNRIRARLYSELKLKNFDFVNFIHPNSFVSKSAKIGENCFIYENCSIGPFANLGNTCVICSGANISHSSVLEDNVYLAAGTIVGGFSKIGKNCFIGLNSTISDKIILHEDSLIAAGSVLLENTKKPNIYRGNPAKDTGIKSIEYVKLKGGII